MNFKAASLSSVTLTASAIFNRSTAFSTLIALTSTLQQYFVRPVISYLLATGNKDLHNLSKLTSPSGKASVYRNFKNKSITDPSTSGMSTLPVLDSTMLVSNICRNTGERAINTDLCTRRSQSESCRVTSAPTPLSKDAAKSATKECATMAPTSESGAPYFPWRTMAWILISRVSSLFFNSSTGFQLRYPLVLLGCNPNSTYLSAALMYGASGPIANSNFTRMDSVGPLLRSKKIDDRPTSAASSPFG
mmetsp:Transcript_131237/g.245586  ORF Transcript_131237/g.245586 Transcript_131237/m.245586 type:complete len:248 (-) Transcript_131237:108-851(-)